MIYLIMRVCDEPRLHLFVAGFLILHDFIHSKSAIIDLDNGLLSGWYQAIIWINAGIFLIRTVGANFREIVSDILTCS